MNSRPIRFHVALKASRQNFEQSVGFYALLFGQQPAKHRPGYAKFDIAEPSINLTLNLVDQVTDGNLDHMGIQVWSDETLKESRERIVAAGLSVRDENEVGCCYADQNKFWVKDPDGREIEFFHVLADIDVHSRNESRDSACCVPSKALSPCCTPEQKAEGAAQTGCC